MRTRRTWITRAVLVVMLLLALTTSVFASNPTDEPGSKMIECPDCGTSTACMVCYGLDPQCESCGGTNVCATCGGTGYVQSPSSFYNTAFSLLPPVIAIALALITKEVYSSLFIGILVGGLLYSNFAFEGTLVHVFSDGIVSVLSDSYNVGILIFLVILGTMVCLMNKAGAGLPDLHRRLLQLPHRGQCDAPHHRPASCVPGQAGLYHRRHRCPGVHHRPHLFLGGRRLWLCGGRPGSDPVHPGHPL